MEISRLSDIGVKIKTKAATVVIDPSTKTDADVIIIIDPTGVDTSVVEGAKVIIDGPGEYEVMGVSISGEKVGSTIMYRIDDETYKVILGSSKIVSTTKEEEGNTVLLVKAVETLTSDSLSSFVQDVCIVFGKQELLPVESETVKKLPKVNVRRMEDLKGSVVLLAKE